MAGEKKRSSSALRREDEDSASAAGHKRMFVSAVATAAAAAPGLEFTTLYITQGTTPQYAVQAWSVGVANGSAVTPSSAAPALHCAPTFDRCRVALGTGTHGAGAPAASRPLVSVFAMGNLFPAAGSVVSLHAGTGKVQGSVAVPGYVYGLEDTRAGGQCDYVGVAVQGSVESEPFIACVRSSGALERIGEPLPAADEIMSGGAAAPPGAILVVVLLVLACWS